MAEPGADLLLRAACAGDGEAFAALVRPHLDALYAFVRRVGPGADAADDILQNTLVRAWRRLGTFRGESPFGTWLFSIAWRVARTEGARVARAPVQAADLPEAHSPDPGPEEQCVRRDLAARARGAMELLPAGQCAAIARVDLGGEPLAAAAAALGVPLGTLKTHLHRGRRRLAELLGRG